MTNVMRPGPWKEQPVEIKEAVDTVKRLGAELHDYIAGAVDCREASIAKTKLEEAVMWAVKGLTK